MVKIQLDDDFYLRQATVYGIVSELPEHRLSFLLNNDLGLKLIRNKEDRELYHKGRLYYYCEFSFEHEVKQMCWTLTANKGFAKEDSPKGSLWPTNPTLPLVADLKTFDYFLWYDHNSDSEIEQRLNICLKEVAYVRAFQKIDFAKSKHINNLLLEY